MVAPRRRVFELEGPMRHGQMLPSQKDKVHDLLNRSIRAKQDGKQLSKQDQDYLNKMKSLYPDEYEEICQEVDEGRIPWYL
jgi:hypothetical protein